ncbi:unnamed protein product, partial [Lymnaea stagnalis]
MCRTRIIWTAFVLTCQLCLVTDGVIIRPFRVNQSLTETTKPQPPDPIDNAVYPIFSASTSRFQPTGKRCCDIGQRVAKKKMACDIALLAVIRKFQRQKYSVQLSNRTLNSNQTVHKSKLSEKISKCSAAFPREFVKCCRGQEEFFKQRKKCLLKPKPLRQ